MLKCFPITLSLSFPFVCMSPVQCDYLAMWSIVFGVIKKFKVKKSLICQLTGYLQKAVVTQIDCCDSTAKKPMIV